MYKFLDFSFIFIKLLVIIYIYIKHQEATCPSILIG